MSKIIFYDNHGKLSYNPNTEKNVGVGGAETVLISTAKELVKNGHDVWCYINCNFPDIYDGVKYMKYYDYTPQNEDVLVGFENFPSKHNAKMVVNWSNRFVPDDIIKYPDVDKVIVVSQWHKDFFSTRISNELLNKTVVINPGISEKFFLQKQERQSYNITYCGHPGKGGMKALLEVQKRLIDKFPQASIHVYGGGGLWGWDNEQYRPVYNELIKNGILYHGQIGKEEMAVRLNQAQIFLYPVGEHHKETFCLVVLEAMASGCVVVASHNGNIPNLVKDNGYLISGDINHYFWSISAIDHITKLFESESLMKELSEKSRKFASDFTWNKTAKEFEKYILNI